MFKTEQVCGGCAKPCAFEEAPVGRLVAQHHIQQRRMDLHAAVVFDEAQFTEFVHKSAHPRPRGADHSCQCRLTDIRYERFELSPNLGDERGQAAAV